MNNNAVIRQQIFSEARQLFILPLCSKLVSFELQQTYFQRTEVSIHVSVIYRHVILEVDGVESLPDIPFIVTEPFFVISPDDKHDQFFTVKVLQ
jgi:hypothetical protein